MPTGFHSLLSLLTLFFVTLPLPSPSHPPFPSLLTFRLDSSSIYNQLLVDISLLTWALFVLLLSTLECCQPTELIWVFFLLIFLFYPPPLAESNLRWGEIRPRCLPRHSVECQAGLTHCWGRGEGFTSVRKKTEFLDKSSYIPGLFRTEGKPKGWGLRVKDPISL